MAVAHAKAPGISHLAPLPLGTSPGPLQAAAHGMLRHVTLNTGSGEASAPEHGCIWPVWLKDGVDSMNSNRGHAAGVAVVEVFGRSRIKLKSCNDVLLHPPFYCQASRENLSSGDVSEMGQPPHQSALGAPMTPQFSGPPNGVAATSAPATPSKVCQK